MSKIVLENAIQDFSYNFSRQEKDSFKEVCKRYVSDIRKSIQDRETEEHCKPFLKNLLSHFYEYPEYQINTSGRADQTIKKGDELLVLIETKNPKLNNDEMPLDSNLNKKGLWELFLYYIENTRSMTNGKSSRIVNANLRTLIVTNYSKFIIFDAQQIDRLISKKVIKFYEDFKNGHLQTNNNEIFYSFAKDYFDEVSVNEKLKFVYLDVFELSKTSAGLVSLAKVIKSYLIKDKAFSTYKPNVLNYHFYEELLYIMGLKEVKNGSKSIIELDKTIESSLGHQVYQIMVEQKDASEEEAVKKAISLPILWINRLLFIKLFEGQLTTFNDSSFEYKILDNEKIKSFEDLFKLFFNVLGKVPSERGSDAFYSKFTNIPYLNSSLFEKQDIETKFVNIIDLKNTDIKLCSKTRIHGINKEPIVKYIIDFLNSYRFNASLVDENTISEKGDIIDSSVLGLIFEKINGYKDGAFYTRSEITDYISKQVIEKCILDKFNSKFEKSYSDLSEIKDFIDTKEKRLEINDLIDSIKICDPAVGSGHFLVSALNRIITIKYELGVLFYCNGDRFTDCVVTDVEDILEVRSPQGERFVYNKNNALSCLVQESLFNEKRRIIENCLFGVDLNPDAVSICRLRLWIELLKNAYYKNGIMETLPNIDINIKFGNSLISTVNVETGTAIPSNGFTSKKMKDNVAEYKELVVKYKHESNKTLKRAIKEDLNKLKCDLNPGDEKVDIYGNIYHSIDPLYRESFEWMFEFPELLTEEGVFEGFDIVFGNPPYGVKLSDSEKKLFKEKYANVHVRTPDTYRYFISRSLEILKNGGVLSFIVPNNLLFQLEDKAARSLLVKENTLTNVINLGDKAFDNANVPTCIFIMKKAKTDEYQFTYYDSRYLSVESTDFTNVTALISNKSVLKNPNDLTIGLEEPVVDLINKIQNKSTTIDYICTDVASGISTGADDVFKMTRARAEELNLESELLRPLAVGKNIFPYKPIVTSDVIIYSTKNTNTPSYSNVYNYLLPHTQQLSQKRETKKGIIPWWSLHWPRNEDLFKGKKIVLRQTSDKIIATLDENDIFTLNSTLIIRLINEEDYEFVLGVLNSNIGAFMYKNVSQEEGRVFAEVKPQNVRKLFVPNKNDIKEKITSLVTECLSKKKEDNNSDISSQLLTINKALYDYYELNDKEIALIEKEINY